MVVKRVVVKLPKKWIFAIGADWFCSSICVSSFRTVFWYLVRLWRGSVSMRLSRIPNSKCLPVWAFEGLRNSMVSKHQIHICYNEFDISLWMSSGLPTSWKSGDTQPKSCSYDSSHKWKDLYDGERRPKHTDSTKAFVEDHLKYVVCYWKSYPLPLWLSFKGGPSYSKQQGNFCGFGGGCNCPTQLQRDGSVGFISDVPTSTLSLLGPMGSILNSFLSGWSTPLLVMAQITSRTSIL